MRRAHALLFLTLLACRGAIAAPRLPSRETLVAVAADQKLAADAEWASRDAREAELEAARAVAEKVRKAETPEEREEREEKEEREQAERALKKRVAAVRAATAAAPSPVFIEGGPDEGDDDGSQAVPGAEAPSAAAPAPGPSPRRRSPRLRASDVAGASFPGPFRGANTSVAAPYVTPTPAGGPAAGTKMSLDAVLTEDYDPSVGGRGLRKGTARAEAAPDAPRRALNIDDVAREEAENDRPKRVIKALTVLETANAFGARPGDVPVVAPTPLIDANAARPPTSLDASRLVLPPNDTLWAFAATGSVDQPARRFRPPDQSLCVGGGVVITGNNLVFRSWNATTGEPLQGPISPQDFFGVSGDMSDPVCIFDASDTRRFYSAIFAYADTPIKSRSLWWRFPRARTRRTGGWDPTSFATTASTRTEAPSPAWKPAPCPLPASPGAWATTRPWAWTRTRW